MTNSVEWQVTYKLPGDHEWFEKFFAHKDQADQFAAGERASGCTDIIITRNTAGHATIGEP